MWKYTGKGQKRSPAQQRQNRLFTHKGQLCAMQSVLSGLLGSEYTTDVQKVFLTAALRHIERVVRNFDKEVGWKK